MSHFVVAPRFVACPDQDCGCIAEVTDRFDLLSTDGLVSHVVTYCVRRHIFRLPASRVVRYRRTQRSVTSSYAGRQDG